MQLEPLILRASPFNGWSNMVDAASKRTATTLRSRARALPEMSVLTGKRKKKTETCRCEPAVVC